MKKPKKIQSFSMFFTLQPWNQNRSKMLPETLQKLPSWVQNGNLAVSMAHLKGIVAHLGRNLPPTWPKLRPSSPQLCWNFVNQMTLCTRRNAPKAPKILSAFNLPRFSIPLELHFLLSLFVQCHSVRSNSLREQVPFSPALARFSSPLELFPDRRAAIARMYVFMCEAKLIACLPCGCPIFCANLLPCLSIYHASNPYSQNDTRTLSRPISQHPSSNRHGGGCCEALG